LPKRAPAEEAFALNRRLNDQPGINHALEVLAWVQLAMGELPQARQSLEAAVAMARKRDDRLLLTRGLHGLGSVLRRQGAAASAQSALTEAFLLAHELGDRWHMAGRLLEIAQLALEHGETTRAARIVGACENLFPDIKKFAPAFSAAVHNDLRAKLPARLGRRRMPMPSRKEKR
jgi:hypothetical protein